MANVQFTPDAALLRRLEKHDTDPAKQLVQVQGESNNDGFGAFTVTLKDGEFRILADTSEGTWDLEGKANRHLIVAGLKETLETVSIQVDTKHRTVLANIDAFDPGAPVWPKPHRFFLRY